VTNADFDMRASSPVSEDAQGEAGESGTARFCETRGVLVFVSGEEAKEVAVDEGAESFRAVGEVAQTGGRENYPLRQAAESGEGDPVPAVELAQVVKEFGFELRLMGVALWLGFGLRRGIGASSFMNSHGCLLCRRSG
jgi:hypothetical protein